jgi:hypothetical protein
MAATANGFAGDMDRSALGRFKSHEKSAVVEGLPTA